MESIVQTSSWRQGATERHIINLLDDLIRAEEALTELAARGFGQGPMWTVMKTKPNPITNGELLRTMGAIIGCLGDRLSLLEPEAHIFKERVALGHGLGNSRHPDLTVVVGADAWRIPTIDHAERCLLKRSVEGGVVDVFCPRKPSDHWRGRSPVMQRRYILMALFTASVCPSVCGWNAKLMRSLEPDAAKSAFRNAVKAYDFGEEDPCHRFGRIGMPQRNEVRIL